MASESHRSILLRTAHALLCGVCADGVPTVRVIVERPDGGTRIVLESRPGELASVETTGPLSDTQRAILDALKQVDMALSAKQLARKAGMAYSGHFREMLKRLADRKPALIARTVDGWRLVQAAGAEQDRPELEAM